MFPFYQREVETEVSQLARDHTTSEWRGWDSHSLLFSSLPVLPCGMDGALPGPPTCDSVPGQVVVVAPGAGDSMLEGGSQCPKRAASRMMNERKPQAQPFSICLSPLLRPLLPQLSPSQPPIRLQTPEPPAASSSSCHCMRTMAERPVLPGTTLKSEGKSVKGSASCSHPCGPHPLSSFPEVLGGWC